MRITFFLIILAATLLVSCQGEKNLTTDSGYDYVVHTAGDGQKAQPGDYVYFHAQMRNGETVIYGSRGQGQTPYLQIPLDDNPERTPSPVEDVLKVMSAGDSVTVFIPIDTFPQKPQGFEDTDVMLYDVVCLEIKSAADFEAQAQKQREAERIKQEAARAQATEVAAAIETRVADYASGKLDGQLQTTDSGLKYIIHEEGTGAQAAAGNTVSVHYYGVLTDGTMFDNSFERGSPIAFPLGQGRVIPGWDEGIALLKKGSKATLFIPYQLAYGETGSPPAIPGKAELLFYVELVDLN